MRAAPTTLEALFAMATSDLTAMKPGVLLEWAFINAQAVGVLERERLVLGAMDQHDSEIRMRLLSYLPIDEGSVARLSSLQHGAESLATQRRKVDAAAAYVRATEHVMALLERAAAKKAAKPKDDSKEERPKAA